MSLTKFLIIILVVTLLALLYVYQESKIIQSAYQEQERLALLEILADRNNNLRYSIDRQMSLVSISEFWQDGVFEWPGKKYLVQSPTLQRPPKDKKQTQETDNLFTRFFGLKSQAEATPSKPR